MRIPRALAIMGVALAAATSTVHAGPGDELVGFPSPDAPPDAVRVETAVGQSGARPGEPLDVAVVLRMGEGWHVNSDAPHEDWLIPTDVTVDASEAYTVRDIVYPKAHDLDLSFSDTPMSVLEGEAPIGIRLDIAPAATGMVDVSGTLTYQACNDETCLAPESMPFTIRATVLAPGNPSSPGGSRCSRASPFPRTAPRRNRAWTRRTRAPPDSRIGS